MNGYRAIAIGAFAAAGAILTAFEVLGLTLNTTPSFPRGLWRRVADLKRYPSSARMNGEEGKVIVKAVIRSDGHLADVSVKKSSGHELLDAAAAAELGLIPLHCVQPGRISRKARGYGKGSPDQRRCDVSWPPVLGLDLGHHRNHGSSSYHYGY